MLTYWNWLVPVWMILIILISTTLSFQCIFKKKGPQPPPKPPATAAAAPANAAPNSSKPSNPTGDAPADGDGHYEDVTVG